MEFRKALKLQRVKRDLTQEELGKAIGRTGQQVGHWERGYQVPRAKMLIELANALECDFILTSEGIEIIDA